MRAFTIIEILIAFFILSLIAGSIFAVTNIAILSWDSNRGGLELVQEVRQAMDGMTREARQSNGVTVNNGGSALDFSIPNVIYNINYSLNTTTYKLIREHPPNLPQVLANNINYLNFCCIGGASCTDCGNSAVLQIHIQANKTIRNIPQAFSLVEEVKLRNE